MNRFPSTICALALAACASAAQAQTVPSSDACAPDAVEQARKLLSFHLDGETEGRVEDKAKPLPSIVNPGNRKQRFDVLEVWGFLYKGEYRMRFEYYRLKDGECVLMGQEILEKASL